MAGPNLEDDLDDSLLMLAAGGVESGEESPNHTGTPRSRSQSPAHSRASSRSASRSRSRSFSPRQPSSTRNSPSSTTDKMPVRTRAVARRSPHDSEEEGEAYVIFSIISAHLADGL
jgi:hypothetical protein